MGRIRPLLLLSCGISAATRSASVRIAARPPHLRLPLLPHASRSATPVGCTRVPAQPPQAIVSVNPALNASLPFRTLAFYVIAPIAEPPRSVDAHQRFLSERGMVGRVYVCADGINAQVSGTSAACAEYRGFLTDAFPAQQLLFKEDPVADPAFPKLRVKHKGLVPTLPGEEVDLERRGVDLSPEQWAQMLADESQPKLVLDVRNGYEWDVGRFDGAERPEPINFAESDEGTYGLPTDAEERERTPVMMYCTGGIRCEYFSAKLKQSGFKRVYKLQGGVQHYGNTFASMLADKEAAVAEQITAGSDAASPVPHWKGSLFVFDRRNTMPMGSDQVVGKCLHCGEPTEAFINCGNIDCNKLHLVCSSCLPKSQGYCCQSCSSAPRRRPLPLSELAADEGGELSVEAIAALTQGPPPGVPDPNKLANVKPANVRRKEFNADTHGFRAATSSHGGAEPDASEESDDML